MRTNVEGIFAIGVIAGTPWLAHKASAEGIDVSNLSQVTIEVALTIQIFPAAQIVSPR